MGSWVLVFFIILPQVERVKSRVEKYVFAPKPEKGDTVRGRVVVEVGDMYADTFEVIRSEGMLKIMKGDSVMMEEGGGRVSLMGTVFEAPGVEGMDSSFWAGARVRKEGGMDVVEGEMGEVRIRMWVDGRGRVMKQEVVGGGRVVLLRLRYDGRTGYVEGIEVEGGEGVPVRVWYEWLEVER